RPRRIRQLTPTNTHNPDITEPPTRPFTGQALGLAFTEAALGGGDRVVAVARDISPLADLREAHPGRLMLRSLDVTDRGGVCTLVDEVAAEWGIDIVVNTAGQMLYGMVEEATEEQIRAHLDVNLFGAVWICQAVLPHLRAQGSGRIVNVTSMGAGGGFSAVGFYSAAKSALDSLTEALAMEVEHTGIRVTSLQPGGYATDLFTRGTTATEPDPAYDPVRARLAELWDGVEDPDPATAAPILLELVAADDPPRRLVVGARSLELVEEREAARREERLAWAPLSQKAEG
ncbi:SDR family NAD(P)-dependent oxidoreductase, partial [Antribacter gilvus]|uniref:SDR family NAD(P)-dependent oxidoreductase n=1 Tax=Antribacter gilvus TaxID=2304675 RepID=UPI001980D5B4